MKKLYFLAGLPRSGSTLLAAILNQRPDMYVSPTSGLSDMIGQAINVWENNPTYKVQDRDENEILQIIRGIIDGNYSSVDSEIVVDKSRTWPNPIIMSTMKRVLGYDVKIIATVRNIPDCAASFVRIAKPSNLDQFLVNGGLIDHLKTAYVTLDAGYADSPESFCMVDYDALMEDPLREARKIEAFLELEQFDYDFDNIESSVVKEKDEEVWGIPDLHKVAPKLERQHNQSSIDVLGARYPDFVQNRFWLGENLEPMNNILDEQLKASSEGDFETGWKLCQQLEQEQPENNRAAYNRGWYLLYQGHLSKGHKLLDRGRIENVFGNAAPMTPQPMWTGEENCGTVLLILEGGLGDQIWGARFALDIQALGNKVIIACSGQLVPILKDIYGVDVVIEHSVIHGVYHDYWVPSMSAVLPLGYEYEDIEGSSYIFTETKPARTGIRIGLRWQGNPRFEHEQKRLFPPDKFFDALKPFKDDVEFVSLQRDEGSQHKPNWVAEVPLETWEDTKDEVAKCDLIISSCTSVAHLAAAMGKETWILSPILPYFLWAPPGEKTCWYNSATIFKQTAPNDWSETFDQINTRLEGEINAIRSRKRK